jgi:hypothetical protein
MIASDIKRTALTTLVGVTVLAGGYAALRPPRIRADALPRWSCAHPAPPVEEVPPELLTKAGFRDTAALRRFTNQNRAPLTWTYFSVQNSLRAMEEAALSCVAEASATSASASGTEARLTWHLKSDTKTAVADNFELARLDGDPALEPPVRTCLARHLLGKRVVATAAGPATFLAYDGTFPFFRQLRFSPRGQRPSIPAGNPGAQAGLAR